MQKEQLAVNPQRMEPPKPGGKIIEMTPRKRVLRADGMDEEMYATLENRAKQDVPKLMDPAIFMLVQFKILNMLSSVSMAYINTYLDLALRYRNEMNVELNKMVKAVEDETQPKNPR